MATIAERLDAIAAHDDWLLVFDGCHKIYWLSTQEQKAEAQAVGYTFPQDFFPADEIHNLWKRSCGLRFVSPFDLNRTHPCTIEQFEKEI